MRKSHQCEGKIVPVNDQTRPSNCADKAAEKEARNCWWHLQTRLSSVQAEVSLSTYENDDSLLMSMVMDIH